MTERNVRPSWLKSRRRALLIGGPILFLAVATFFYLTGGRYVSTEAAFYDDDLKDKEGYWHAAYVIPWFLGYNTKMVKKDEVPKTYEELLNPKWKRRKIALGSDNGSLVLSGLMGLGQRKSDSILSAARQAG